jgi:hypothetical protein
MNFLAKNPPSPPSRPSLSKNKLTSRRGIRGAASGLRAAPFDTENCTFLIAAVGLLSGGSLFVCIYDLTRRRISAIFEHLALFLKSMDLTSALC